MRLNAGVCSGFFDAFLQNFFVLGRGLQKLLLAEGADKSALCAKIALLEIFFADSARSDRIVAIQPFVLAGYLFAQLRAALFNCLIDNFLVVNLFGQSFVDLLDGCQFLLDFVLLFL